MLGTSDVTAVNSKTNWSKINDMTKSFCNNFVSHYSSDTHIEILWNIFKDFCMSCLSDILFKIIGNISDHLWITPFITTTKITIY